MACLRNVVVVLTTFFGCTASFKLAWLPRAIIKELLKTSPQVAIAGVQYPLTKDDTIELVSPPGESGKEIYSVSKDEYLNCRLNDSKSYSAALHNEWTLTAGKPLDVPLKNNITYLMSAGPSSNDPCKEGYRVAVEESKASRRPSPAPSSLAFILLLLVLYRALV